MLLQVEKLEGLVERLRLGWRFHFQKQKEQTARNAQQMQLTSLRVRLINFSTRIKTCRTLLTERLNRRLTQRLQELAGLESQLKALSPLATLGRGFAIVQLEKEGTIVRSASMLQPGDSVMTRFAKGRAYANVKTVEPTEG